MTAQPPVQRMFLEWQAAAAAADAAPRDISDADLLILTGRAEALADDILDLASEGPLDFACKLVAYTFDGQHDISNGAKGHLLWAEARQYVPQAGSST